MLDLVALARIVDAEERAYLTGDWTEVRRLERPYDAEGNIISGKEVIDEEVVSV